MDRSQSATLFAEAQRRLVGGVNSPVRAFNGVGGEPFFATAGEGPYIVDADGNRYVDYVLSWGPLAAGHAHPHVVEAVRKALEKGSSFGIPTEAEVRLAQRVAELVPSIEKLRLVNSGTEATMSAIRLARGYTGRDLAVKLEGCYHGHADGLLVKAGSGLTTLGVPTSPGVPEPYASCALTAPFNDLDAMRTVFEERGGEIACVILEPVAGNMGVIPPEAGYLEGLRQLTKEHGALLIFDEVMTGFRVALGGAQERYGVIPDLTCLGKVIGGGMPVGAYGGPAEIMDHLAPIGPVYQAGTLAGNPLATAAGLATLELLTQPGVFEGVEQTLTTVCQAIAAAAASAGEPVYQTQAGSMACTFFSETPVRNYQETTASNTQRYAAFFWAMLDEGVYLAPSQYEAMFASTAHDGEAVSRTAEAAQKAFKKLNGQ